VIAREFDAAGGLLSARLYDGADGPDFAKVDGVYVTSFGETKRLTQRQSSNPNAPGLDMSRDFDGNGRLVRQISSGRKDVELGYEDVTGRVTSVADNVRQLSLDYKGKPAPWADGLSFGEAQTGLGAFVATVTNDIQRRDAYGRPTLESSSDGSVRQTLYDEAGNPLASTDGAATTEFAWDSRGSLLSVTRPGPQGATTYGYDLDGRIVKKHSIAGASGQSFDTSYQYEPGTGRLQTVTRPDGATETYTYYPDDTVMTVVRSDGAQLTYTYDPGNRVTKRAGAGGSVLPGGETFAWDLASRLSSTTRVNDKGDPIPGTAVSMSAYDLAGRAHAETIGARPALTRDYDVFGHVTSLGLPTGIGAFGALSYLRAYEAGTQRLSSLTATGDAPTVGGVALASLGAKWAWLGEDHILGVTTNGPLAAAHRFGYVGGPGGPTGAAKWKLGTLTIGTAGGSDPFKDAGIPLGDPTGKGSRPWGQFAYGYLTGASGDGTKLGRAVTSTGMPGSILAGQGWAWGIDASKRLTSAYAGPGNTGGIDAVGAALAAFERFKYDYGSADQLRNQTREVAAKSVSYETGGEGRPDSRQADAAPAAPAVPFTYDGQKRRTEDDRFTYTWHWHGKLATATVKACWPIENGETQDPACPAGYTKPPYAGQKISYEYDSLSRLLARTHLGAIPAAGSDAERPFIEKRAYLWDDKVLLAETAYSDLTETLIRWRKSYIPGASLDDHVQLRVETYDLTGRAVATDRLYSYLRDEQSTVLGLADETSDPNKPAIPVRYVYTPYGDAHAEIGPELRKAAYQSDVASVTKPDSTVRTQTNADSTHFLSGAIRLTLSADLDPQTFGSVALEVLRGDVWTDLTTDVAIGRGSTATNTQVDLLPLAGFELGKSYRVRVTSGLHDVSGRALSEAQTLEFTLPDPIPADQVGSFSFAYERVFPVNYDSYFASGTDAGLFPGGQPMLFQGAWTDPVTGLQYKRERFYDPRNGIWLSQDPLGDIDSPNLYGFVGMRPHEKTDPMGLAVQTPAGVYDASEQGEHAKEDWRYLEWLVGAPTQLITNNSYRREFLTTTGSLVMHGLGWVFNRPDWDVMNIGMAGVMKIPSAISRAPKAIQAGERVLQQVSRAEKVLNEAENVSRNAAAVAKSGETAETAIGRAAHSTFESERAADDAWHVVNETMRDAAGDPVRVPRRVDLRTGAPVVEKGTQTVRPDAVSFSYEVVLDDKPLTRSIVRDRQEIIRNIEAYRARTGALPRHVAIQRYDPVTLKPVHTDVYSPEFFLPKPKP
jgi:RHS repeat-associated protein